MRATGGQRRQIEVYITSRRGGTSDPCALSS